MASTLSVLTVIHPDSEAYFVADALSQVGYEVQLLPTAQSALSYLQQTQPQLIILSAQLPDTDGYQLCQQISASSTHLPIIFIGTLTTDLDRQRLWQVGGCDYLPRPLVTAEIIAKVEHHLRRRQQEQSATQLHQREREFRALVENSPDVVSRLDRQYRYCYINPAVQAITGIAPAEFIGKTNRELGFPQDLVDLWEATMGQVFSTQQEYTLRFTYPGQPASSFWQARLIPELIDEQVASVLIVSHNITSQRQAEASLRQSEARFRAVFEQAAVGINQADLRTGRFLCVNESFCQLLGYSEAELLQLTYQEVSNSEDIAIYSTELQQLYQGDLPSFTFEKRYFHKDGTPIWTSITLSLVYDEAGQAFADMAIVQDISDRKQAEAALQASEATNRLILQAIPDLLIYTDADGHYIDHIPGHNVTPLIGGLLSEKHATVDHLLPPALAQKQMQAIARASATRKMQIYEHQFKIAGQTVDEEIRVVPLPSDRLLVMVRNITERKRIEAELRRREVLLASLNQALPMGLLVADPQTHEVLAVNRQFFKIWRLEALAADVAAGRLSDKELLLQCLELTDLEELLATATPAHPDTDVTEDELPLKDGRILRRIYGQVRSEATRYGYFYLFEDVTLRKQAEHDLRQGLAREQAMARLIKHMRQTLDISQIFATTVEELRQVLRCDRVVLYQLADDGSGQFVAESLEPGWMSVLSADAELRQALSSAKEPTVERFRQQASVADSRLQSGQREGDCPEQFCLCIEDTSQAQLPASQQFFLQQIQAQASIAAPIWQGNQLWGWLTVYQNRHPRQWQESDMNIVVQTSNQLGVAVQQAELFAQVQQQTLQLKQTAAAANQANQAKSLFLANMSHELRTPLNVILGLAQVITRDRQLPDTLRKQVNIINRSGAHLLDLINSILDLSKIESGHITLQPESCDLAALMQEVVAMLKQQAESKGLTLTTWQASDVTRYIEVDIHKLRQILINLVGNAIKFTPAGSVSLRLLSLSPPAEQPTALSNANKTVRLCFEVVDTGVGIAAADLERIFTAFEQTSLGQGFTAGTGLGLTISRHFAELMGGHLTAESTLGHGSCFRLYLSAPVATGTIIAELPTVIGLEPGQKDHRILVVDDQSENRYMLRQLLETVGLQVKDAASGHEALTLWQSWQPDLIWLDLRMLEIDGYEVARRIRQQEAALGSNQATCIIALSASAMARDRHRAIAAGCDDFLGKPFRMQDLFLKMANHLHLRYRYASREEDAHGASASAVPPKLTTASFQTMPADWVAQVKRAAELCDDVAVAQLIEQIPAEQRTLRLGLELQNFLELKIMNKLLKSK
ncbi:MAG: PAS domain S-box protein, partial [Leptolyngbya sp. SIO4C5]|nr:PAS domain S-box protein [Leptolyngbya sp. SIO4C5]